MKKIGKSDVIGQKGMSLIEGVVLSMGFMFYPTGGVEAGIDGYIELRDEETEEVGNLLLQVQGKATEAFSRFAAREGREPVRLARGMALLRK